MKMNLEGNLCLRWLLPALALGQLIACSGGGGSGTNNSSNNPPVVTGTAPAISVANNTSFTIGKASALTITVTGNPTPTLALTGALPQGVTFELPSGVLSGTPSTGSNGEYSLTVTASNGITPSAIYNFTLTVNTASSIARVSLPKTGQTGCWSASGTPISCANTGQDGDFQKGLAWPTPRFVDNADQTITDKLTGLVWTKDANLIVTFDPSFDTDGLVNNGAVTWLKALEFINRLNSKSYLGFRDWRLPNIDEVMSIKSLGQNNIADWLTLQGFMQVQQGFYWTSTSYINSPSLAYFMNINFGGVGMELKTGNNYVWPVRDGASGILALPKTGQTTCYNSAGTETDCTNSGQDGELQKGASWPTQRFINNGDGTIYDSMNDRVWSVSALGSGPTACWPTTMKSWDEALTYINCLNNNSWLGKNDWRLPNLNELTSLINYGVSSNIEWLQSVGFSQIHNSTDQYWSSSTVGDILYDAFSVDLSTGYTGYSDKRNGNHRYVWPVSGRTGN